MPIDATSNAHFTHTVAVKGSGLDVVNSSLKSVVNDSITFTLSYLLE
jgi:hypothetical protein